MKFNKERITHSAMRVFEILGMLPDLRRDANVDGFMFGFRCWSYVDEQLLRTDPRRAGLEGLERLRADFLKRINEYKVQLDNIPAVLEFKKP